VSFNLSLILREAATATPERAVARFDGGSVSYAELDAQSDQVAAALSAAGVGAGDRVGLQLPNVAEFLVVYFALLKMGAVSVPMNVLLKAPETAHQLRDSGAVGLVSFAFFADEALKGAAEAGVDLVYLVGAEDPPGGARPYGELLGPSAGPVFVPKEPTDTAVIIYTSGTTGLPKGVELTHFQLYMNSDLPGRLFGMTGDDVVIATLPLFHVFGLSSLLNVVVRFGASMVLIPRFNAEAVLGAIGEHGATIFGGVPTMFADLVHRDDLDRYDLSTLRVAVSGGAAIPAPLLAEFERRFGATVLEGYGLTESASSATFNRSATERKTYSVGKPIWGTELEIWDRQHQALPPGAEHVGEIVIRGYNVMKGYYNNPAATAAAFTGSWLHTGDLGYIDPDGFVFIVDRIKELIIRGGYNVYPSEVEAALYAHPAVREAAVVGIADERLGEEVAAYVSLKPGAEATPEELIAHAETRLANYKYPRHLVILPDLPKGSTGKIQKLALRPPAADGG
jgi:long-chain acyl-CoA synthetase